MRSIITPTLSPTLSAPIFPLDLRNVGNYLFSNQATLTPTLSQPLPSLHSLLPSLPSTLPSSLPYHPSSRPAYFRQLPPHQPSPSPP